MRGLTDTPRGLLRGLMLVVGVAMSMSAPAWAATGGGKYWLRLEDLRLAKPKPVEATPPPPPEASASAPEAPLARPMPQRPLGHLEGTLAAGAVHRLHDPQRRHNATSELHLKARSAASEISVLAEARLRWDGAHAKDHHDGAAAHDAYAWSADWRELSLTAPLPAQWRSTLGYQQLNWGRADNLRALDQVNPLDLRHYVLPDIEEYRIALPMLKAQGPLGTSDWSLETYWAPRFQPHRLAVAGSEFDLQQSAALTAAGVEVLPERRPAKNLRHGEWGAHLSRSFGPLDLSLIAMRLWDRAPVYRLQLNAQGTGLQAQPEYRRLTVLGVGASLATEGGWVWRSEMAHVPRAVLNTTRNADGLVSASTTTAMLGLDRAWRDWIFTTQVSDRVISGWQEGDAPAQHQPIMTVAATGNTLNAKLESRLSCAWMMRNEDGSLCQLRFTYKPTDTWFFTLGGDAFIGGAQEGFFGRFDSQDRLWAQLGRRF